MGAIIGVGLVKGLRTVSGRMIAMIGIGWVTTPLSAGIMSYVIIKVLEG